MKYLYIIFAFSCLSFVLATTAYGHVTLNPREVVVGRNVVTVRVPNERDVPTVEIRLEVPEQVEISSIHPVAGWSHTEKREASSKVTSPEAGHGAEDTKDRITEITWRGGAVGVGEFIEFPLSVQYSESPESVVWKAYQTYQNGEVVAWDDSSEDEPAPKVKVLAEAKLDTAINDIATLKESSASQDANDLMIFKLMAVGAMLLSVISLAQVVINKKK